VWIARVKLLVSVGLFKVSYLSYVGRSNAMHQVYCGVTWIHGHTFLRVGIPKSLAQVWICSWKENAMLKSQDWQVKVWQDWSDSKLKWLNCGLYLILSIGMPYYQEGCNIDYLTRSKVLIDDPWEDPERKPLRTNIEILEWSSLDLMDQVGSYKQGFGVLWPWPVWGTGLTGQGEQRLVLARSVWPVWSDSLNS